MRVSNSAISHRPCSKALDLTPDCRFGKASRRKPLTRTASGASLSLIPATSAGRPAVLRTPPPRVVLVFIPRSTGRSGWKGGLQPTPRRRAGSEAGPGAPGSPCPAPTGLTDKGFPHVGPEPPLLQPRPAVPRPPATGPAPSASPRRADAAARPPRPELAPARRCPPGAGVAGPRSAARLLPPPSLPAARPR